MSNNGIFLDSGNISSIKTWQPYVGGVTTNQVILFTKDQVRDIPKQIELICDLLDENQSISIELPDSEWDQDKLLGVAKFYNSIDPNKITIKVPIITQSTKGLELINNLSKMRIRTNATVGMNFGQLVLAAEAGRSNCTQERPNYVSLFWGRTIESVERYSESVYPRILIESVKNYFQNHNLNTKIIVGSIRDVEQIREAFSCGADIVTITPELMVQMIKNRRAQETIHEFDLAFRNAEKDIKLT